MATDEKPEVFADQVNRDQLVGAWLGEAPVKDGSRVRWLMHRRRDGTFTVQFQITGPLGKREQAEAGFWGFSGGVYFTFTRALLANGRQVPVNATDASYYDAYKALVVSPSEFTYKSLSTQELFTVRRVPEELRL